MIRNSRSRTVRATSRTRHAVAGLACLALPLSMACADKPADYSGPYGKQVADAIPRIENAVGLKFKTPPVVEVRSKEQVRAFVVQQVQDPKALREFTGMEAAYKRLGMLPATL